MKISILGSGSSGNSTFVEADEQKILIDAGFSGKKTVEKLNEIEQNIEDINAILITHEHGDHIKGAGILSRKYNIPIYISKKSYENGKIKLGKLLKENLFFIEGEFYIETLKITPIDVLHDAERTMAFSIENKLKKKFAIATDIGYTTNIVREGFKNSAVVVIESNYDHNMLMDGPYPWDLKNRVKGRHGHLSNIEAAKFIEKVYTENLKKVYLVHLSKENNTEDKAIETVRNHLLTKGIGLDIEVVLQDKVSSTFYIE